ncbi:MAG TPA: hypothetical protein VMZ28_10930 [Kofleriaceae bacterium]|nr:hypothetical protein [Kofleriaceae bacterium]
MTHARLGLVVALCATLSGCADEEWAEDVANGSPEYLVVYNNNVENMLPASCDEGDWNKLMDYVVEQSQSPDIFTTQQISNTAQLDALTARMTAELPGTYAGVIAIASPGSMGYTSRCGKLKNRQTNAVIYRTDRFTLEATARWRSDAPADWEDGSGGCRNLDDTPTSQDRVENVAVRLHDDVAGEDVTVASIHWPTNTWHGPDCADENMREAANAVENLGGTLEIVAGDANTTKGTQGWWNDAMEGGFRDPIAETCPSSGCPDSTSTLNRRRIDFMLVKGGHGFSGARTISEESTGGKYSGHRALRASVYY